MGARIWGLFWLLLLLTGSAVIVLVSEGRKWHESANDTESFQRLVGGLGFGPALDLSACTSDFDPRLDGSCSMDHGPIPGGACFSARQGKSMLFYPPLNRGNRWPGK